MRFVFISHVWFGINFKSEGGAFPSPTFKLVPTSSARAKCASTMASKTISKTKTSFFIIDKLKLTLLNIFHCSKNRLGAEF
ncbi:hypothetical protein D6817_03155 [Candidatus Pacearchaeota archaeon]|nr:MAG: hypothetical protein D6817_03155 [Candidatus Pacearchaeota archaeon]